MGKTKFTHELFETICQQIATSERGLVSICRDNDLNASTFYDWLLENPDLANKYARAKELQAEFMAEQIIEIADDGTNDYMTIVKGDTEYNVENKEVTNRSRLRVDARKWVASKLYPKKYGDKVDVTTDGEKITNLPPFMKANESQP